ncbi:MAG: ABC transporter permease [Candidatus Margulisiibacteriota bacterium]
MSRFPLLTRLALGFLALLAIAAVGVGFLPFDPNTFNPNLAAIPLPPGFPHVLGTDDLGRDILIRLLYGARVSLSVACIAVVLSLSIGVTVGAASGFFGGWTDKCLMRFTELVMAIPGIFLILVLQSFFKPSLITVVCVIGLTGWMGIARFARAEVLSLKERLFITAARARGISEFRLMIRHILPLAINPVIVAATLGMSHAILSESVLSFLGLGVQPPQASWGNMLENSLAQLYSAPWMVFGPGLFITLTVLSLTLIGDQLRTALEGN